MAMTTTFSEDQTTEKHVDHLSHPSRPSPHTVTPQPTLLANALSSGTPHFHTENHVTKEGNLLQAEIISSDYQGPIIERTYVTKNTVVRDQARVVQGTIYAPSLSGLLEPESAQHAPSLYPQYGYSNGLPSPQSAPAVSNSKSDNIFPLPDLGQPGLAQSSPAGMDTTGQIAPSGMEPRVRATLWEDEGSLCFQVESRGICVARREDNHMINGTKLLNVAGMTRDRRDRILKSEEIRHSVKIGPMHLKGIWIPFERALDLANEEEITEMMYPLFVHNIGALLNHPTNQTSTNQTSTNQTSTNQTSTNQTSTNQTSTNQTSTNQETAAAGRCKAEAGIQTHNTSAGGPANIPGALPSIQQHSHHHHMALPGPQPSTPSLNPANVFPTPPYSLSSVMGSMPSDSYQSPQAAMSIDTSLNHVRPGAVTPAASNYGGSSSPREADLGVLSWLRGDLDKALTFDSDCEEPIKTRPARRIRRVGNEDDHFSSNEKKHIDPQFNNTSQSGTTGKTDHDNMPEAPGKGENARAQVDNLSPSQNSPQSDSEHSSDSEPGLLTRNERRDILIERLMAYFFDLLSSCPSPVPSTTAESPMVPSAKELRQLREDDTAPLPLPSPRLLNQSMDRQPPLFLPRPESVSQVYQPGAPPSKYDDHDNSPMQDGLESTADQPNISASTAVSDNRQSTDSYQATKPTQKRDRKKEDDEDKDERKFEKRTRMNDDKNTAPKRLACPYFKNDPEHPRLGRSCSGPGWGTVHRIKEHLDRNHALPPSCVRCYTAFETESDRDSHMRLQNQCQVNERPGRMHGFDTTQKELLRSRPTGYKHMSEIQKWCHIYMILFPETTSTDVPSPYYEFVSLRDSGHPVDPMIEYENFLRQELPGRVRHQLELRIDEILDLSEETLRGQMIDFVRDIQLELFQTFRASRGPARPNGDSGQESASIEIDNNPDKSQDEEHEDTDAQDSTLVARNTEPPGQFDSGQCSWEEELEAYRQVPPLDFSFTDFDDFDGALFDFSSVIPAVQDSAYGTLSISHEETDKDEFIGNETSM